jgi:hypothetical protein
MSKKKVIPQIVKDIRNKIKRDIDWSSEKSYFILSTSLCILTAQKNGLYSIKKGKNNSPQQSTLYLDLPYMK